MKKLVIGLLVFCFLFGPNPVFASNTQGKVQRLFNATAVASAGTATSVAIPIKSDGYFGVWYQATSVSSTPDLLIQYEMSYDTTSANFVIPATASDIETNLTAETAKVRSVQPPPMAYLRVKVTGNGSNPADTLLTMYIFSQE